MKKKIWVTLITLFAGGALAACGNNADNEANSDSEGNGDKLSIITTFYPIYDFTQNVVGDEGDVELLIPAGTEPHDFEPSAKQIAQIQDADAFVYHDENMETWVPDTVEGWEEGNPNIVKGTEDIELMPGNEEEHDHDHGDEEEDHDHGEEEHEHSHEYDPHTWLDPKLAVKEVEAIRDQLSQDYPDKEEAFEENAENYIAELEDLDQEYESGFSDAQQKSFVTQHAAFGYLANEYDLNQVPISGLSPDEEPSPERLAELKDYVEDNDIHYIYFEENASDKIAQTLADEVGVELEVLNPLESLTDNQIDNGEDYVSVMQDNLKALEKTTDTEGEEVQPEESTE
ncbi:metal ABC transporter substrate-binding protein [Tetragenococcus koreensis]|uniref:Metal ABC transporter substrate-binding protein n=1 Tax=Tetragenococcus koreensis TaxID=290335 RepID=A0AAN4ZNF6_9ENTE|nr:zinc ABC transporter substrate-binding protein [Tetragenococcus koreensis]GEN90951.1 hypothetical protein TKO01_09970 [Tetragenococcus koreensis]GEQ49608.1 metal ABC transporter substrate-binding protein [Tetragenococcus koreensis]GEQ52054.1 metal ABC transporter substrate-binding protein [Tetragenococcus koreensis]GEQ54589.1 metal ABC transporter substrate-binding protein [Tetragenococcus koreensis]